MRIEVLKPIGKKMKLKELIFTTNWRGVKSSLLRTYPHSKRSIGKFQNVFDTLLSLHPHGTKMRLFVEEDVSQGEGEESRVDVFGKDGTLNKDLADFRHFRETASEDFANSETSFALELVPWEKWLGMELDSSALQGYANPDIVAFCLWEMTFFGFDQATIQKEKQEIDRRVAELENMSEEQRKKRFISGEKVMQELEAYLATEREPAKK
jgi:hypothetical protein